jgi:transketolase
MSIEQKSINTIRTLSMDAVQKANSGHPGTPMALAPAAYALWRDHLRHNPANPHWFDRDRFVLSNGHASMLQYAMLHLTGYDLPLEEIENFRQWGSRTAGHPEYHITPGVETTTGPLGQGVMSAVGMAMAEAHLAALFNRDGHKIVDHYTYVFCGDGDLMEGASHEAASLAGHLGLGKLIYLYDDNHISIEGDTDLTYSDDAAMRFTAYGWHIIDLGDKGNDVEAISAAFAEAKSVTDRPSLIILRTHIGYGSPNFQDTPDAHGSPLGAEEIKKTKAYYGWPEDAHFLVPDEVREHMGQAVAKGQQLEQAWEQALAAYQEQHPELGQQFQAYRQQDLPAGWDQDVPDFAPADGPIATRAVSANFINAVAPRLPWLVGGSADLEPSTKTMIKSSGYYAKGAYDNRNFAWGIREHVMAAASTGLTLHGGVRPFAATFFVFTDYARPAIRLSALMEQPVIYVMTHDSIGLGEDGPTHQPIEHLASLRAMPNLHVLRPADANEATYAWRAAIQRTDGPTMLVLTRQKLPVFDRQTLASADGLYKGAYVLSPAAGDTPAAILIATGSEVELIMSAQEKLREAGIDASVVSMPSWELFRAQSAEYRESVLPAAVTARLAIEAGSSLGWHEWVGSAGRVIGIDRFGASAPYQEIYEHYGLTVDNIVSQTKAMLA